MELLGLLAFGSTKLTLGLGALLLILGICLLWFSIVERIQIKRRKKSEQNKIELTAKQEDVLERQADEAEAENAVETMSEMVDDQGEEQADKTIVDREIAVDEKGETVFVEVIAQPVETQPDEDETDAAEEQSETQANEDVAKEFDETETEEVGEVDEDVDEKSAEENIENAEESVEATEEVVEDVTVNAEETTDDDNAEEDIATVAEEIETTSEIAETNEDEQTADETDEEQSAEAQADEVVATEEDKNEDKGVSVAEAHVAMTDEYATDHIVIAMRTSAKTTGKKAVVNIDTIGANFNDGDTVDLAALKAKKLVSRNGAAVKILARGWLGKKLNVVADDFSADAVKMILLTGGTVTKI